MKTSELIGPALDWAVAKILDYTIEIRSAGTCGRPVYVLAASHGQTPWTFYPSEYWAEGGPIIEREWIELANNELRWKATLTGEHKKFRQYGPTPLIAAMRCFVASRLGDEVDIPKELL